MSPDIHLVVGSTGAGKSTFARALAQRSGGVCFVVDEWMQRLFHPERPKDAGFDWYAPRIERCTALIWSLTVELVRAGTPSVLEIGMTQRSARAAFYERARAARLSVQLHVLDAPAALRWQRVEHRNRQRGATFALEVTRGMFDFVEQMWEPPDAEELRAHDGERIDTAAPAEPR
jgi:predicted kinase